MKWTKPSAETIAYFERIAPGPPIEARQMFGMPARFLNGHMLVGVFGDTFMLHLSESDREACIEAGAKPFAPLGREAKAYVDIEPGTFDDRALKEWIVRGMRYLAKLPPKLKPRDGSGENRVRSVRGAVESKRGGVGARSVRGGVESKRGGVGAAKGGAGESKRARAVATKAAPKRSAVAKKSAPAKKRGPAKKPQKARARAR